MQREASAMITKGERGELRSIVRQQFKVLRHEIEQRQAELIADLDEKIAQRYADVDTQREQLMWKAFEIVEAAQREITDLFRETGAKHDEYRDHGPEVGVEHPVRLHMDRIGWSKADRVQLRRAAVERIEANVKGAVLNLERREADLLRTLAVGAIESEEERTFLEGIPTVAELVPAARLTELEAQFTDEATP
jgi:hypothetical protein